MINRLLILFTGIFLLTSCQQEVDPTIENINSIFETKDFSVEFVMDGDRSYRLSFRDDFMTYVAPEETQRKTISYNEAVLVNSFVQNQFGKQDSTTTNPQELLIYNDTKKVTLLVPEYEEELAQLLNTLNLNYVPTPEK